MPCPRCCCYYCYCCYWHWPDAALVTSAGGRAATAATADTAATTATTATVATGVGQMQLQRRPRESLTPQQLREWYTDWGCRGGRAATAATAVTAATAATTATAATGGGQMQLQRRHRESLTPRQLREWYAQSRGSLSTVRCPYVIRTGDRSGQACGTLSHTQSRCFARLSVAWRTEFGDEAELPTWLELLGQGVDIYALDYDAILTAMYALPTSADRACYLCVSPDPGIAPAALGAGEAAALGASVSPASGAGESALSGVSQVDPPPLTAPVEVTGDSSPAEGGPARGTASGGAEPWGAEPGGAEPGGAEPGVAEPGGAEPGGAEPGGAETGGAKPGHEESGGAEPGGTESGGAAPGGAEASGEQSPWDGRLRSRSAGTSPLHSRRRLPLSPQQLRAGAGVSATRVVSAGGCGAAAGAGAGGSRAAEGAGAGGSRAAAGAGAEGSESAVARSPWSNRLHPSVPLTSQQLHDWYGRQQGRASGARGSTAGGTSAVTGAGSGAGSGGACTGGTGAAGAGGAELGGAPAGDPGSWGAAIGDTETRDPGTGGAGSGGAAAGGAGPGRAGTEGSGAVGGVGAAGGAGAAGGLTERREPVSLPVSPVRSRHPGHRVPCSRQPAVIGTHLVVRRPSSPLQRVPLSSPPASSLPTVPEPESDRTRAAHSTVTRLLATVVTDPSFESAVASALVAELVDFAAACRLDYVASLVAESESVCPPSIGGECALGTDVLEDRQEDLECLAAAAPHLESMLLALEGDPDAPDIPTPRSYAEAIAGEYSSQWQTAMDAEMASWKSTGTYVDEVPPHGANIVSGMWIFRVKRLPGSRPVFKARYVARGFSQREGVDFFQTFSPTPKMITLWVLLHVAAQRDYELHSLDFSTAFLQGSLHEEIWLRRPPGFTGSFPPGTQWSLRRPVYGLRQAPREWHDTLRTTLAALGFAPSTADPSLFLRSDTSLPPFYILVYVDDLVFATADTEALALVKSELQERHTCTDMGELRSYLGLQITRDRARRTITLTQSHMVQQVLQSFGFTWSSPQHTPLAIGHSLSAPPSNEPVEPSGPYPELVGCLMYLMTCTRPDLAYPLGLVARFVAPGRHRKAHMDVAKRVLRYLCGTSGMGLVLGGRSAVVLTGHSDASWVVDQATQRSSQGYTFSLGSGSVSWRSTQSSSVLSSSCEAEIYATAMAAQELRWLTYLLTDLGERPRSPPVLYVDNKAAIALCQEHRLEHRTKHIALRYFLARELQQRGQLRLAYVATRANTADIFTKALPTACFASLDWSCDPLLSPTLPMWAVADTRAAEEATAAVNVAAAELAAVKAAADWQAANAAASAAKAIAKQARKNATDAKHVTAGLKKKAEAADKYQKAQEKAQKALEKSAHAKARKDKAVSAAGAQQQAANDATKAAADVAKSKGKGNGAAKAAEAKAKAEKKKAAELNKAAQSASAEESAANAEATKAAEAALTLKVMLTPEDQAVLDKVAAAEAAPAKAEADAKEAEDAAKVAEKVAKAAAVRLTKLRAAMRAAQARRAEADRIVAEKAAAMEAAEAAAEAAEEAASRAPCPEGAPSSESAPGSDTARGSEAAP
ncbi:unnamed protein product [Closterium sp. NIES-53]